MSHRFLFLMVLIFPLVSQSQIDQKKLDSLSKSIDSSAAAHKVWQDSFAKEQDRVYQEAIKKTLDSDKGSRDQRKNEVESQRTMQGILIALVVIVIAIVLLLLYRRKKST